MTQTQAHNEQELLEKFDRESVTRQPRNRQVALLIAALAFFYSIFHLYTTFYPMPTLLHRAAHVAIGITLIFFIYPSRKNEDRGRVVWYDWILAALSMATFGYSGRHSQWTRYCFCNPYRCIGYWSNTPSDGMDSSWTCASFPALSLYQRVWFYA